MLWHMLPFIEAFSFHYFLQKFCCLFRLVSVGLEILGCLFALSFPSVFCFVCPHWLLWVSAVVFCPPRSSTMSSVNGTGRLQTWPSVGAAREQDRRPANLAFFICISPGRHLARDKYSVIFLFYLLVLSKSESGYSNILTPGCCSATAIFSEHSFLYPPPLYFILT